MKKITWVATFILYGILLCFITNGFSDEIGDNVTYDGYYLVSAVGNTAKIGKDGKVQYSLLPPTYIKEESGVMIKVLQNKCWFVVCTYEDAKGNIIEYPCEGKKYDFDANNLVFGFDSGLEFNGFKLHKKDVIVTQAPGTPFTVIFNKVDNITDFPGFTEDYIGE
jgi:hypothetical protein